MSADMQDLMAKLQMQLANQGAPSFGGLTAPVDPSVQQNMLTQLQNQNSVDQAGNTAGFGEFNPLFNAGKKDFQRAANSFGDAAQQSANVINGGPPTTPQSQAAQAYRNAILSAKQDYASQIASGVAPDVAHVNTLAKLVQAGVPNADTALLAAQKGALDNQHVQGEITHNLSQARAEDANVQNQAFNQAKETAQFIPRPDLSNSEYLAQQDPNTGKIEMTKRGDKMPPPPPTPAADAARDVLAKKIANYDLQLGTAVGRGGGDLRQDLLTRALALNPDFDEKNYKQSADALKAYGPSGTQGQLMLKTQNAMNHLQALKQYGDALDSADPKAIAAAQNYFGQAFNLPANAAYSAVAPIVANEVSGSLVKGGGGVDERQDRVKELGPQLNGPARGAAINGMASLLGAQYKNNKHLYETTTLRKDFEDRFPIDGTFPAPPGTGPAPAASASSGWGTAVAK